MALVSTGRPRRPLRVLVVEPAGQLWGSERSLLANLAALPAGRAEVAVCLPADTPLVGHLQSLGFQTFPTFISDLHRKSKLERLRALIGLLVASVRFSPDVLHVNQTGSARIALMAGRILGVPVTTHVQLAEDVAYLEGLGRWLGGLSAAICISEYIRGLFAPDGPLQPDRLPTFYYPVDASALEPARPPDSSPRVACVGRLVKVKGQDVLLEALGLLHAEGVVLDAVFVGSTPDGSGFDSALRTQAQRLGIEARVEWVGFDPHPERRTAGAVAAVCPSRNEPFGLVIVEAWIAGTIPIAWRGSGGAAELIAASGGGLLYDEPTGESLAETLTQALHLSSEERLRMVGAGQQWVREACDPTMQAARLADVWNGAAKFDVHLPAEGQI